MDYGIVWAIQSVVSFAGGRSVKELDGRLLPGQLLGVEADPRELRAVAEKISNRLPVWRSVRESLAERAAEIEARRPVGPDNPLQNPSVSFLYSPWG